MVMKMMSELSARFGQLTVRYEWAEGEHPWCRLSPLSIELIVMLLFRS